MTLLAVLALFLTRLTLFIAWHLWTLVCLRCRALFLCGLGNQLERVVKVGAVARMTHSCDVEILDSRVAVLQGNDLVGDALLTQSCLHISVGDDDDVLRL